MKPWLCVLLNGGQHRWQLVQGFQRTGRYAMTFAPFFACPCGKQQDTMIQEFYE